MTAVTCGLISGAFSWFDPDVMILNPQVPLEMFLPPANEGIINLVASHDPKGFNSGVMFMRVNQWTLSLLVSVLNTPFSDNKNVLYLSKDEPAFEQVLEREEFRGGVVYQPRPWFNAMYSDGTFEGSPGSLLVHIAGVNGEKWRVMDEWLEKVRDKKWEVNVQETAYEGILLDFWQRIRQARITIKSVKKLEKINPKVKDAATVMRYALDHYTDDLHVMVKTFTELVKIARARPSE